MQAKRRKKLVKKESMEGRIAKEEMGQSQIWNM